MAATRTMTLALTLCHVILICLLQDTALADRTLQLNEAVEDPSSTSASAENVGDQPNEKRHWSQFRSWGKRSQDDDALSKRWKEMSVWGKREADLLSNHQDMDYLYPGIVWEGSQMSGANPELDKKWKQMSVWGKRNVDPELEKRWKQMAVWGKRSSDPELEKKWKEMAVWGKRDFYPELDKKWKEMSVWGKRDFDPELEKKWKEMSVWGKRDFDPELEKKWKEMAVWGKRNFNPELEKKWKEMSVWGKRDFDPELEKKWKQMSVWGKRGVDNNGKQTIRHTRKWRWANLGAKRPSWSSTGFSSWGKRSEDLDLHDVKEYLQKTLPVSELEETPQEAGELKSQDQGTPLSKT
ncbi:hypothetical protein Bpfe_019299 [Biomphalaria pfeifferi]|uniref:Uncharacterized protein n=1 Tax=Biomphalaria pfeifferi TaxID=112525 RepID=A0AAD8BB71_BIOPF|nr:hypothetical protein Bpfe_019299 [Biomphalaria pfeifferi]